MSLEEKVQEKIFPMIQELGFEIEYVEFVKEGQNQILRVVLDKTNATVSIDDCELVSRAIEEVVDGLITKEYVLEVSSPGLERQLKNMKLFKKYVGHEIMVKLFQKKEFGKELTGILKKVEENESNIVLECNGKDIIINKQEIATAHTIYDFKEDFKEEKNVNLNQLNHFNKKDR